MSQPIKIYVGNIPQSARNSELKELFEKFGKVVECDILKEFAFVHMEDTNDAKAAIAGLNDSLWMGSRIRVELSTTRTNKGKCRTPKAYRTTHFKVANCDYINFPVKTETLIINKYRSLVLIARKNHQYLKN